MPVLEPDEVLTAEEAEALEGRRAEDKAEALKHAAARPARAALGAFGGELLARIFGARPALGRALGMAAARLADPKTRAQLGQVGAQLKAAVRREPKKE